MSIHPAVLMTIYIDLDITVNTQCKIQGLARLISGGSGVLIYAN